jgi:CBS domain-containing protein
MARLMVEKRISGVPVLDRNKKLVGIATEGDCLQTDRNRYRA